MDWPQRVSAIADEGGGGVAGPDADAPDAVAGDPAVKEAVGFSDLKSLADIRTALDEAEQGGEIGVGRDKIPYWNLADDSALLIRPRDAGAVKVGKNGFLDVGRKWYQYDGDAFNEITAAQVEAIRAERKLERVPRVRASGTAGRAEETVSAGPTPAGGVDGAPVASEGVERRRTLDRAKNIFWEKISKGSEARVVIREAARGLSPNAREKFRDYIKAQKIRDQKGQIPDAYIDEAFRDDGAAVRPAVTPPESAPPAPTPEELAQQALRSRIAENAQRLGGATESPRPEADQAVLKQRIAESLRRLRDA